MYVYFLPLIWCIKEKDIMKTGKHVETVDLLKPTKFRNPYLYMYNPDYFHFSRYIV